jgi:hypothetical protein
MEIISLGWLHQGVTYYEACTMYRKIMHLPGFNQKTWKKNKLRRSRNRWEDNMKTDLKEIRHEGVEWIQLAQDKL